MRRTWFLMVVVVLCLVASGMVMAEEVNLLPNPSVEESSSGGPKGWTKYLSSGNYKADFEWSKGIARTGNYSLKIGVVSEGASAVWISSRVTAKKDQLFRASAYVKTEGVESGQKVTISLNWLNSSGNLISGTSFSKSIEIQGDMDWTLVTVEGAAPENCRARIQVSTKGNKQGSIWFDDFAIVLVE